MSCWAVKTLQADTIGSGVPCGHSLFKVHSIFQKAINLQLVECCTVKSLNDSQPLHNSGLVTILGRGSIDYPRSIRITSSEDFRTYGLIPSDGGSFDACGVTLDKVRTTVPIYISFAGATKLRYRPLPKILKLDSVWQYSVNLLATMQNQAAVDLNIKALTAGSTIFGTANKFLINAAINLGRSVQGADISALRNATLTLMGLGQGLTPSGDDFLCGFLAAAHCKSSARDKCLIEVNQTILANLIKTNIISATFLRCATYGEVSSSLYNFAKAIQDKTKLEETLKQLCTMGHSSGMDTATGFLYGLKIWSKKPQ